MSHHNEYSKGYTCTTCGKPRSNSSMYYCQECNRTKPKVKRMTNKAIAPLEGGCAHYWIISVPEGAVSAGECKLCGDKREFLNTPPFLQWEDIPVGSARGA